MYCVQCGVELADGLKACPLCKTEVVHPAVLVNKGERMYPPGEPEEERFSRGGAMFVVTAIALLAVMMVLLCDLGINREVSWSGYAVGGLLVIYSAAFLPQWFRRPNPVIFFPVFFAVCILFLFYVNWHLRGEWFLSFALPVAGGVALVVCAVVSLVRYLKRGRLIVFGSALVLFGALFLLIEFLADLTFGHVLGFQWGIYPMAVLCFSGIFLLIVAFCRPLKESLRKKLFL